MFLGKWNSDNSYYLYEQIKTLFYQAMGAAAFIRAEGAPQLGWALLAPCKAPGCVWELEASLGGVLLSCILRASLTHPTQMWFGGRRPKSCPQPHRKTRVLMVNGGHSPMLGCWRMDLVLPCCWWWGTFPAPSYFPKLCSHCADAGPNLWGQWLLLLLHTQHFKT